jgi:5'-nucleotidase
MQFPDAVSLATQDEILTAYIVQESPVNIELDGRIAIVDGQASNGTSGTNGTTGGSSGGSEGDATAGGNSTTPASAATKIGGSVMGSAVFATLMGCAAVLIL